MVATDTVVGIVGAVVLVAVMVGVFVYEFNNAQQDGSDFSSLYPSLNATGDMDGDGELNQNDDDMDGDGTPNEEDDAIATTWEQSGAVAVTPGSNVTMPFPVERGATHINVTIAATPTLDRPDLADVTVTLVHPDGTRTAAGGSGEEYVIDVTEPGLGEYMVEVTLPAGSLGAEVDVTAVVHYTT